MGQSNDISEQGGWLDDVTLVRRFGLDNVDSEGQCGHQRGKTLTFTPP